MGIAFLFPGQGAQRVGMGMDLHEAFPGARDIFDRAEEVTKLPLKKLCFEGPAEELARTDICQPAIFTVSAATLAAMRDFLTPEQLASMAPTIMAGLSLGEYTAVYAAGAMDFEAGLSLVMRRGELMQKAAETTPSGMVSVMGLDADAAGRLCGEASQGQVLTCANFNCPGQVVISGELDACRRVMDMAGSFGASGAVPLKVAGAFHSELMRPAMEALSEVLNEISFVEPRLPIVANVDACAHESVSEIKRNLLDQLISPVLWHKSMENI
ncbi:MAG: ACP S-malonyltransferase, partial [Planctomycetes bacterium]|nr:ACP S-malonyltransferase [Planctomycetota bacterium]